MTISQVVLEDTTAIENTRSLIDPSSPERLPASVRELLAESHLDALLEIRPSLPRNFMSELTETLDSAFVDCRHQTELTGLGTT